MNKKETTKPVSHPLRNHSQKGLLVSLKNSTQTIRNEVVASKGMEVWDESYFEKQ